MPTDDPGPRALLSFLAEQDELQLQVRALLGDWDALIATAGIFPEPMVEVWRVVHGYLVTGNRPVEGSIENAICAEYVLRCRHHAPPPPPPATPEPVDPAGAHLFKSDGTPFCAICRNGPNSAIHRPGAPR